MYTLSDILLFPLLYYDKSIDDVVQTRCQQQSKALIFDKLKIDKLLKWFNDDNCWILSQIKTYCLTVIVILFWPYHSTLFYRWKNKSEKSVISRLMGNSKLVTDLLKCIYSVLNKKY